MRKFYIPSIFVFVLTLATVNYSYSQGVSNKGTEFWAAYGHNQQMGSNTQDMIFYFCTDADSALVTLTVDSSGDNTNQPWQRVYRIAPHTAISTFTAQAISYTTGISASGPMPKTGIYDCRLYSTTTANLEGIFRKKGIHIESTAPITAYLHVYSSLNSGASVLIPVAAWGREYTSINSKQEYSSPAFSWINVIANQDNTPVTIVPSVPTRNGHLANVPFQVMLNKGQIYQMLGAIISGENGYELTGTTIVSTDPDKKITVFGGSSRTRNPCTLGEGGGDYENQQLLPMQTWGKKYLVAPTSRGNSLNTPMTNIYKIVVSNPQTVVRRNGVALTGLTNNSYYIYESTTADYIEADQPVQMAQFISGGPCIGGNQLGDPEMFCVSPMEQGIKETVFNRSNLYIIDTNLVTLLVPTAGLSSLKVDNVLFSDMPAYARYSYAHPNIAGYSVAAMKWPAEQTICRIQCDSSFSGITYGLGDLESYGYNIGTKLDSISKVVILPVLLDAFSAYKKDNDVKVQWKTSLEINTNKFEVQRSLNGSQFFKAGEVQAQGRPGSYNFIDVGAAALYVANKNLFYRLVTVNTDGSREYSPIVKIRLSSKEDYAISVAPNPFISDFKIMIDAADKGDALITVKDITGRTVMGLNKSLLKGANTIAIADADRLTKGVYLLTVEVNGTFQVIKLVK